MPPSLPVMWTVPSTVSQSWPILPYTTFAKSFSRAMRKVREIRSPVLVHLGVLSRQYTTIRSCIINRNEGTYCYLPECSIYPVPEVLLIKSLEFTASSPRSSGHSYQSITNSWGHFACVSRETLTDAYDFQILLPFSGFPGRDRLSPVSVCTALFYRDLPARRLGILSFSKTTSSAHS